MKHTSTLLLLLICATLSAQNYPPPSGTYCSCPPTNARSSSIITDIALKDHVKGFLVRVSWSDIEPTEDLYDWTLIDQQIDSATKYGKYISLGVNSGPAVPQWVYDDGAQLISTLAFSGAVDTIAVAWDPVFNQHWTDFIDTLGKRYNGDTSIALVYMNTSTSNGFEMQMPFNSTPSLTALGYSDSLMTSAWEQSIDAFGAAFPDHYLSNDFHPVNGSDAVGDSVYAYARQALGSRYGASAWWWTQNNTTVYAGQYSMLQLSAQQDLFAGVQVARNHTSDSAQMGPGGLFGAIELAMNDGICYWEVWNSDLQNPTLDSFLTATYCLPVDTITDTTDTNTVSIDPIDPVQELLIYPNPATNTLYISTQLTDGTAQLQIVHVSGKVMLHESVIGNDHTVDLSKLSAGLYWVLVHSADRPVKVKRLVVVK